MPVLFLPKSIDIIRDIWEVVHLCAFGGVGSVADVEHAVGAEIAADGAFVSLHGVGGPQDGAHSGDDAGAGKHQGHHGAGLHERGEGGEEGLVINHQVDDVGVVLTQDGVVQLHHLHAAQAETFAQQALQDDTGKILADAVRLEQNECFFVAVHNVLKCVPFLLSEWASVKEKAVRLHDFALRSRGRKSILPARRI